MCGRCCAGRWARARRRGELQSSIDLRVRQLFQGSGAWAVVPPSAIHAYGHLRGAASFPILRASVGTTPAAGQGCSTGDPFGPRAWRTPVLPAAFSEGGAKGVGSRQRRDRLATVYVRKRRLNTGSSSREKAQDGNAREGRMARPRGVEPLTFRFVAECSIH